MGKVLPWNSGGCEAGPCFPSIRAGIRWYISLPFPFFLIIPLFLSHFQIIAAIINARPRPVDILINNAGIFDAGKSRSTTVSPTFPLK